MAKNLGHFQTDNWQTDKKILSGDQAQGYTGKQSWHFASQIFEVHTRDIYILPKYGYVRRHQRIPSIYEVLQTDAQFLAQNNSSPWQRTGEKGYAGKYCFTH